MRLADGNSLKRIGLWLLLSVLVVWAGGCYMCRCYGTGKRLLAAPAVSADKLHAHVQFLAGELGEHNWFYPDRLHRAADYIEQVWREQGYEVTRQSYTVAKV